MGDRSTNYVIYLIQEVKKMYNLDEEKIEYTLGRVFGFLAGHTGRDCCVFYFSRRVGIRGI